MPIRLCSSLPLFAEWSLQCQPVLEIFEEHKWVKSMLTTIAFMLMREVQWGVKARVTFGAVTSVFDLVTDIYVTKKFWEKNKLALFEASFASLAVSM